MAQTSKVTLGNSSLAFDRSLQAIVRRQNVAVAGLLFRLVALPILVTLLCRQSPGLRAARPLLEALAGLAALAPFALAWGRLTAARIALGRTAVERSAYAEAETILAPLAGGGWGARLFDAAGEGRYHLALTRRALGDTAAAHRLFTILARDIGARSEWGRQASAEAGTIKT